MIMPITLTAVGLAALINIWLAVRCGQVRTKEGVSVGDGGNEAMIRRMRAHSNFSEFTPIVLILIGALEYALGTANANWLWYVTGVYMAGRIAHGIGMDGWMPGRMVGTLITMLTTAGLGLYALALPHLDSAESGNAPVDAAPVANEAPVEEVPAN